MRTWLWKVRNWDIPYWKINNDKWNKNCNLSRLWINLNRQKWICQDENCCSLHGKKYTNNKLNSNWHTMYHVLNCWSNKYKILVLYVINKMKWKFAVFLLFVNWFCRIVWKIFSLNIPKTTRIHVNEHHNWWKNYKYSIFDLAGHVTT